MGPFTRERLAGDLKAPPGPEPGEPFPEFEARLVGGGLLSRDSLRARPALVTLGSLTCPMTAAAARGLKRLHREFGGRVRFVSLYVREAHPGERIPLPRTLEGKLANARAYQARDAIPWEIAVDGVDGALHARLGGAPNAAYLLDTQANVVFKTSWSCDLRGLRRGLRDVASGRLPLQESKARVLPLLRGLGVMSETLSAAGPQAQADVRQESPAIYALARVAGLFRPLPPLARGAAAVAAVGLGFVALSEAARLGLLRRGSKSPPESSR